MKAVTDDRLARLSTAKVTALAVEVNDREMERMKIAQRFGFPFLPMIDRTTFLVCLCRVCGHDFSVRADVLMDDSARCPSRKCQGAPR